MSKKELEIKLDIACDNFSRALRDDFAVRRYLEKDKAMAAKWKEMAKKTA